MKADNFLKKTEYEAIPVPNLAGSWRQTTTGSVGYPKYHDGHKWVMGDKWVITPRGNIFQILRLRREIFSGEHIETGETRMRHWGVFFEERMSREADEYRAIFTGFPDIPIKTATL